MQARWCVSNEKVRIAEVNISLDADATGPKRLEERNALQVIVMRVNGDGDSVVDKGLSGVVPY